MVYLNKYLTDVRMVCISLRSRADRRKEMDKQIKKYKLNEMKYYLATKHSNPKRGCLESHLNVIKEAVRLGKRAVMIFEDDALFLGDITNLEYPPKDWAMLYYGATVHKKHEDVGKKKWVSGQFFTTHAYVINLMNKELVNDILKMETYQDEIDKFYIENIHNKYKCYVSNPMFVLQREGFSDIEGHVVNYNHMQLTLDELKKPIFYKDDEGNVTLKLDEINESKLPKVSVVTPTYNRKELFNIAIHNWENFNYPKSKIEWVVVDDSDEEQRVKEYLPLDDRIKYIRVENSGKHLTIAEKRNIGCQNSSGEIIVMMDDDDIQGPESVMIRVKLLKKYRERGIMGLGCSKIAVYDVLNRTSTVSSDNPISLSESSMAFYKKLWDERPFDPNAQRGEHFSFMVGRLNVFMDIPYEHVILALNHNSNFTTGLRNVEGKGLIYKNNDSPVNFYDLLDEDTQLLINDIRNYIIQRMNKSSVINDNDNNDNEDDENNENNN